MPDATTRDTPRLRQPNRNIKPTVYTSPARRRIAPSLSTRTPTSSPSSPFELSALPSLNKLANNPPPVRDKRDKSKTGPIFFLHAKQEPHYRCKTRAPLPNLLVL